MTTPMVLAALGLLLLYFTNILFVVVVLTKLSRPWSRHNFSDLLGFSVVIAIISLVAIAFAGGLLYLFQL